MSGLLEVGGDRLSGVDRSDREGDQRRRNILVEEAAGHRVLAADRRGFAFDLGIESAQ